MKAPFFLVALALGSCIAPAKVRHSRRGSGWPSARPNKMHALADCFINSRDDHEGAYCLGEFVRLWKREKLPAQAEISAPGPEGTGITYHVRFDASAPGSFPLDYFDDVNAACDFEVARLPLHSREGIGVALVGTRKNRHQLPIEKFYPPEVISRPLTALVAPGPQKGGVQAVTIQLLSPSRTETVMAGGHKVPLAADFSVPWALYMRHGNELNRILLPEMMTRMPRRPPQLYLMEPYDPRKEPLIMIHGMLSNPTSWAKLTNEVWGDAELARRYQVWHYLYNPSAPALYSAQVLRDQLRELRHLVDADGRDPAMQRTTIVAHSMGGLIAKALVVSPRDTLWQTVFTRPLNELRLSPDDRARLKDTFEWQPDRTIHRLVYFAVPNLGAPFVDNIIGQMGAGLTVPPQVYQDFFQRISKANPGAFMPDEKALAHGTLDGVQSLSPEQPMLRAMAAIPFPSGVKINSIIGDRGKAGPLEKSSDGFVPYWSSHLSEAESEVIVPTGHRAFGNPFVVGEMIRALKR